MTDIPNFGESVINMASESDKVTKVAKSKPLWQRLLPLIIVAILAGAFYGTGLYKQFSLEGLRNQRVELTSFVSAHFVLALAIYCAIYILATAVAMPGVVLLTITGGFLFGIATGTIATAFAATAGASALFWIARSAIGGSLRRIAGPFLSKVEAGFQESPISFLFSMRFIPAVPWFIANIIPVLLGAKFRDYLFTTFFGILPGTLAYSWIGAGLGATFDQGKTPDLGSFAGKLFLPFSALVLISLMPAIYKRLTRKKAAKAGALPS